MSILDTIKKRRSIRIFKPDKVSKKEIDRIIEAGIWAPTSGNTKPFKFLVLDDREKIDEFFALTLESIVRWKKEAAKKRGISITELYENYKKYLNGIQKAPVFVFIFLDLEKGAASFTNGNVINLVSTGYLYNSLRDSLFLCVENMLLEATALGLGSLYFELPSASKTPVNKLFNINNSNEFFTCIPIGYADEEPIADERNVEDFLLDYD